MKPPDGCTLLLGGARCGKSALAVRLADCWGGPVTFVATAEALDAAFGARIERHRAERPRSWTTVEQPRDVATAVRAAAPADLVVVDCISLWIANLLADGLTEDDATATADELADALAERTNPTIVVTNEVGMGVHPSSPLGLVYRDVLGRVNRRLSERSTRSVLVVAGRALVLGRPEELFE